MTDATTPNTLIIATPGASATGRSIPFKTRATYDVTPVEIVEKAVGEIHGVLLHVSSPAIREEDALASGAASDGDVEFALANVTPAQALEHVLAAERREIEFDRSTADATDRLHYDGLLAQLDTAAWSTDASGNLFIPSIWDGGIEEEGTEWRFLPVSTTASVAV